MDRYCPECHSHMTPSLVGYLCVNCGHAQRFYSNTEAAMAKPVMPVKNHEPELAKSIKTEPKNTSKTGKRQIKSTLKRLMVPELPEPHHHPALHNNPNHTKQNSKPVPELNTVVPKIAKLDAQNPPNRASNLSELQVAIHHKEDTSLWVLIAIAVLILAFAAVLFGIIIFK